MQPLGLPIIAGIWPLASYRNASFMRNEVPGVIVPDSIMERMASVESREEQLAMGIRIARFEVQGLLVLADRFVEAALCLQSSSQVIVCLGIAWPQSEDLLELADGFVHPPLLVQGSAQIVARFGVIRFVLQGLAEVAEGFLSTPLLVQCGSQVVVRQVIVFCHEHGMTKKALAVLPKADLGAREREAHKCSCRYRHGCPDCLVVPAFCQFMHSPNRCYQNANRRHVGVAIGH